MRLNPDNYINNLITWHAYGTLKCENTSICEKVAICEKVGKCENISTLNVKIDAICENITLNVNKLGSLNV